MIRPVQVTFRHMQPRRALEEVVRERAAWLESFYPDIIGGRVVIAIPHRHRTHGRHVRIRVELSLPGEGVVVSHEAPLHGAPNDVEAAVRDAFAATRRRLQDFGRRQRGDVKTHETPAGRLLARAGDLAVVDASPPPHAVTV